MTNSIYQLRLLANITVLQTIQTIICRKLEIKEDSAISI
jgi:hypothetical protein